MPESIALGARGGARDEFAPQHPLDRNFFLLLVLLVWLGVLVGFGWDIMLHLRNPRRDYPLIVHVHAAAFVAWLVLITVQVLLIRVRRPDLHHRLGMWGMGLAVLMPVLGVAAQWITERLDHGTPNSDAPFFSVSFTILLGFSALVAAGYRLRTRPAAHKRLLLLATIYLSAAGFARWWGFTVGDAFGDGYWAFFISMNLGADLLIGTLGAYDLATRKRLHPAYVAASASVLASQLLSSWLYFNPTWKVVATWLAGY